MRNTLLVDVKVAQQVLRVHALYPGAGVGLSEWRLAQSYVMMIVAERWDFFVWRVNAM